MKEKANTIVIAVCLAAGLWITWRYELKGRILGTVVFGGWILYTLYQLL